MSGYNITTMLSVSVSKSKWASSRSTSRYFESTKG